MLKKQPSSLFSLDTRQKIPSEPGIYKMLNTDGIILYIGKAKILKNRVNSYFTNAAKKSFKTYLLVAQIKQIEIIVCESEEHALLLENQLIKYFKPKYNILLKDDKSFPYIRLSRELYPRLSMTRRKDKYGKFFGPFPYVGSMRRILNLLHELFPIRDCNQEISKDKKDPKCINVDIGRCLGPCIYKDKHSEYQELIKNITLLLNGKNSSVIKHLEEKMHKKAKQKRFEEAANYRDAITKLIELHSKQPKYDIPLDIKIDCIVLIKDKNMYYCILQQYREGKCLYQNGVYGDDDINARDMLEHSISQFYPSMTNFPDELYCEHDLKETLSEVCSETSLNIVSPKIGPKTSIIEHAKRNAVIALKNIHYSPAHQENDNVLEEMQQNFNLSTIPKRIIGFDISHYYGQDSVASCVYFENGKPNKSLYRKITIKSIKNGTSNDPGSMMEAVFRRLRLAIKDNEALPDLLLIDGGITQLRASIIAKNKLPNTGRITCISIAKKEEEFYLSPHSQETLQLGKYSPVRLLCQRIRDEAHRFALTFQKQKRQKRWNENPLTKINGVGPKKIEALFKRFKTLQGITNASIKEIEELPQFNKNLAELVVKSLNNKNNI